MLVWAKMEYTISKATSQRMKVKIKFNTNRGELTDQNPQRTPLSAVGINMKQQGNLRHTGQMEFGKHTHLPGHNNCTGVRPGSCRWPDAVILEPKHRTKSSCLAGQRQREREREREEERKESFREGGAGRDCRVDGKSRHRVSQEYTARA
jgi:hypothetical protein